METARWGKERSFGQLFSAAFNMANAHRRWLVPLVVVSMTPYLAVLIGGLFAGTNWMVRDPQRFARMIQRGDWESFGGMMATVAVVALLGGVLAMIGHIYMHAALFGTLVTAARGEPLSLGLALREGLRRFWAFFCVSFWVGLRILAWMAPFFLIFVVVAIALATDTPEINYALILVIPLGITGMVFAIIKQYAYMFAVPARIAGDADNSGDAIRMSLQATDGRKGYLFGYTFVMGLVIMGVGFMLNQLSQALTMAVGLYAMPFTVVIELALIVLQTVVQLGVWLAYADAVATRNPSSPAAQYSLGVAGRPFPIPNFRRF